MRISGNAADLRMRREADTLKHMKNHLADSPNANLPVVDKWGIQRPETTFSVVTHAELDSSVPAADFMNVFAAA